MGTLFAINNFFTGLLPMIWHFGSAGVTAIALLAYYFLAPAWAAPRFRKIVPWIVLAIAVYLVGLSIGVKDEAGRCAAQLAAIQVNEIKTGSDARKDAERDVPVVEPVPAGGVRHKRLDRFDRGD